MSVALPDARKTRQLRCGVMKANVFQAPGRFGVEQKAIPRAGPGEAVIEVRLTTICETDVRIVKGAYQVNAGLTLGHEAVGVIHELGAGVTGYELGQRVLVAANTLCGQCESCLGGHMVQCASQSERPPGGWRLGNSIDGTQAQYVLIPHAQANLAIIPNALSDEQVLLLTHVASTGFAAGEQAEIKLGDAVAVFVNGTVGLCAVLGARLRGAGEIIAVDKDPARLALARQYGATAVVQPAEDKAARILSITDSRGVDVACVDISDAAGVEENFESALRALRPGGTLSSVGVSCGQLKVPPDPSRVACEATSGVGRKEQKTVTTLCPGGKERMARLMRLIRAHRVDLSPLITHLFTLNEIAEAYELFESQRHGVLKVGIRVS
jgi:threonine dehydrogenase-like Zn-dependent dehydrogenase